MCVRFPDAARPLLALLALLPLIGLAGCSGSSGEGSGKGTGSSGGQVSSDTREQIRQTLAGSPDRGTCQLALQQVNTQLNAHPDLKPQPLSPERRKELATRFGLNEGELVEVDSLQFTPLDASYLAQCFLFHDVEQTLKQEKASAAEQAAAAFAWVTRQVIVQEVDANALPPEFVVRRGWGTALERGHVFLALLQEMGLPGCFVTARDSREPWACGVLVEQGDGKGSAILLFDHRLGLPVPGAKSPAGMKSELARAFRLALPVRGPADGQEIATLAGLQAQPDLLKVLTVDEKHPYDVTADKVRDVRLELVVPLSALAPRMKILTTRPGDDPSQQPFVESVHLSVDDERLREQFRSAGGGDGPAFEVRVRPGSAGMLRGFLPESEGGIDKHHQRDILQISMAPLYLLPRELQELEGEPRERILGRLIERFATFQMAPGLPRDLVLRGRYPEAARMLTELLETEVKLFANMLQNNPDVYNQFAEWKQRLIRAYAALNEAEEAARRGDPRANADLARSQVEGVWQEGIRNLAILVNGASARPRGAQVTYALALCMFEQAAHAQRRLPDDDGKKESETTSAKRAAAAWKESASWLTTYVMDHPDTPFTAQARLLRARAQEALGHPEQAQRSLAEHEGLVTESERVARLYLAHRLEGTKAAPAKP